MEEKVQRFSIRTRIGAFISFSFLKSGNFFRVIHAQLNENISFANYPFLGQRSVLEATDGGRISIGRNFSLGANSRIIARRGGVIAFGDNVSIGDGSVITALSSISIGSDTMIAEYVVVRDQDHSVASRPVRISGFETSPISIGQDVWIGTKATVLRGSKIGDGAVIGAHGLVNNDIPSYSLAVGAPARVVRQLSKHGTD